jgi:7,8-dihydropterin-6-yl-methyl-4-(beta-D-ribofuranosyl)aminobenzene 5'-phosphate synthase
LSLEDQRYAVYWALSGLARPSKTRAFLKARKEIDQARGKTPVSRLDDIGSVSRLSVMPLVEFYPSDDRLVGESGVSYLITVDDRKILFDVGCNEHNEEPSPLVRNMAALGVTVADLDAVFISHCHLDHVGGRDCQARRTFSLSKEPVDLGGIPAYVPTPMTHLSARTEYVAEPRKLGEGLASTGPLDRAIWLVGPVSEHALLVNVENKGPIMIVGCGHPSLSSLVERAQAVTGAPLYGIIGGLHFPVTGSRVGKGRQNIIGNGKLPWQRITRDEAKQAAGAMARLDLKLVALSAHDSCDWTLDMFKETLGERYRTVLVGEEIVVG